MARPKSNVTRDANSETIKKFFERSMQLREDQKDVSTLISALNSEMSDAGVDPGVMSLCRRIASLPEGKRGLTIALTRFYFEVLEELLSDDQVDVNDLIRQAKAREMESVAPSTKPGGRGDAAGAIASAIPRSTRDEAVAFLSAERKT